MPSIHMPSLNFVQNGFCMLLSVIIYAFRLETDNHEWNTATKLFYYLLHVLIWKLKVLCWKVSYKIHLDTKIRRFIIRFSAEQSVIYQFDAIFLHFSICWVEYSSMWVSINNEDAKWVVELKKDRFTVFSCKELTKHSAPFSPILLSWRSSVLSTYNVRKQWTNDWAVSKKNFVPCSLSKHLLKTALHQS